MPRFYPSVLISDAYGSVGEVTFYHRNGKCYYRKRSHSRYPGTVAQTSALDVHRRALAAWREVPQRTPFDHKAYITGQNLFVSAYHGFATLGNEHQVYARFILLDTVTGYRSQFKEYATILRAT